MSGPDIPPGLLDRQAGILLSAGLTAPDVQDLVERAAANRADILDYALMSGSIDQVALYKTVADELGLPFARFGFLVADGVVWQEALLTGIAPLRVDGAGQRFVLAQAGEGLRHLLARFRDMSASGGVMTTPQAFRDAVISSQNETISRLASYGLEEKEPKDTVHALNYALIFGCALALLAVIFGLVFLTGSVALRWLSLALGMLFLLNVSVRLSAAFAAWDMSRDEPPPLPDHVLPIYSVLVPLYRESAVVPQLIASLCALDYPRDKMDIQILVEEMDDETRAALLKAALPAFIRITVTPAGQPQTKPRALNVGLALAAGSLCTVYDAEDRPEPDQLRKAAALFAVLPRDYACLQAKLAVDHARETWVTKLFALEYAALFDVIIPGLAAQQLPFGLGGTSNHFRVAHLREAGGWDAWNVTEDADVGMRLFRKGLRSGALDSTTFEEAPVSFRMWFNQRTRWMKGWLQTSLVHIRAPAALTFMQLPFAWTATLALTFGTVISALLGPLLMALIGYEILSGWLHSIHGVPQLMIWTFAITLSLVGIAAMFILGWVGAKRRNLMSIAHWVALFPFYYLMITVAAWRAVKDFVLQPYHWRKTEHGLARLRGPVQAAAPAQVKGTWPKPRWPIPEKAHQRVSAMPAPPARPEWQPPSAQAG